MTDSQLQALALGRKKGLRRNRPVGLKYTLHKINPTSFKKNDPRVLGNTFAKGNPSWNKGLKGIHLSPNTEFKKGNNLGEANIKWRGDDVGYMSLHTWLRRHLSKSGTCKHCGDSPEPFGNRSIGTEWANISHTYKRTFKDFIELCVKCHRRYDRGLIKSL